jgi:hypothetical protein
MADSIQLDILKKLTTHLEGITPAAGYLFDLSSSVFRGRAVHGDDAPETMLSIVEFLQPDRTLETASENNLLRSEQWILLVQGWVKNEDHAHPTDEVYQLKATTELRLSRLIEINRSTGDPEYPNEYLLGLHKKSISSMTIGPGVVSGPRIEVSPKAFFYLPLGINLVLDVTKPFVV